jgi:anti-sigma factor ChrR (cupin superfamily)
MNSINIHADRSKPAIVHGTALPWVPSPESGVNRRMLERSGGEIAIASSIVRYDPGSRFPCHSHAFGEEFIVLEGTFSDEHGDYPVGTYVRNPPNSAHAPFSTGGCIIFVKLRQMRVTESNTVRVRPNDRTWTADQSGGYDIALLYENENIRVTFERLPSGTVMPARRIVGGEEIFVVQGEVRTRGQYGRRLDAWTWSRQSNEHQPEFATETGALLWIKRGHLG